MLFRSEVKWEQYVRCIVIGRKDVRLALWDPRKSHFDRYVKAAESMPPLYDELEDRIVADARGSEVRRWVGWLPPAGFVAELSFCRALADYNHGKFAEALAGFDALVENAGDAEIHPEAIYWQGVAGFMAGSKDWNALRSSWTRLTEEYPGNRFATHASVIEDAPE